MAAIIYDIDKLESDFKDSARLLFELWKILLPSAEHQLLPEERVVFDAWAFDSTYGNGIIDMMENENFGTITRGFAALKSLKTQTLDEFVTVMTRVFTSYSLNCSTGDELGRLEDFPPEVRSNLKKDLEIAEQQFIQGIWRNNLIILAARSYITQNSAAFRKRKHSIP